MSARHESTQLLSVDDLSVTFGRRRQAALRNVSFDIVAGQRVGLVGASGSGKSVTALALLGLLPENAQATGSVKWRGRELTGLSDVEFSRLRGDEMSIVFQEPMTALDPTMTAGRQVAEAWRLHQRRSRQDFSSGGARQKVIEMLGEVGLEDPSGVAVSFPHQLSGGQRQRVLIAMALINRPDLVICDEPTTALDVTVQARVLRLLERELDAVGAACLFISHDLAVVSQVCDQIMVMHGGQIIERGTKDQVLGAPQHPYTQGLVASARLDLVEPGQRLPVLEEYLEGKGADS